MYVGRKKRTDLHLQILAVLSFILLITPLQAAAILTSKSSVYNNSTSTASPTTNSLYKQMTECERSLHFNCALKLGTLKSLMVECNSKDLEICLTEHITKSICQVEDPDTLHTIKELLNDIKRRFLKKKKCGNIEFLQNLHNYFKVLGESIENEHAKMVEYSGSGDFTDDNEDDDEKGEPVKGDSDKVSSIQKNQSTISKDILFWRETAKQITEAKKKLPGKIIFFEDPKYNKKKDLKLSQKELISNAWENIISQYNNWYKKSSYQNLI
ncbi:uncharacterized protein LOC101238602 [Hydra vulgaris]|uniref:uncharacterized protein LOC101238602 n=1 Tax=Hydra vulgaris TaxID=6087 RepID=UPI0002B4D324|nr:uncharacterized protein LOC101238602 [Hydra vulgaris]XP_047143703.1 uncharacterized protein LOC101238602 [Hydra vulgaris]